jgi:hypothetical protein
MSVLDGPGEGTWSVFAQKVVEQRDRAIEERDEALRLLATRVEAKRLDDAQEENERLRVENDALRAKVRTITEHYKPGWVDGLKAVARSAGFDPDDAPHDGVDPPSFIEDVIYRLRREVADERAESERLCSALEEVMGACGPACRSDCDAYYVAKKAIDNTKEKP